MIQGIDVSHYQGVIDWQKVKACGQVSFAFIKATDGQFGQDPMVYRNANGCDQAGIPYGYYHYLRPDQDIQLQIDNVLKVLGVGTVEAHPLVVDVEVDSITLQQVQQFTAAFPGSMLYTDKDWLQCAGVTTPLCENLWIAEYMLNFEPRAFPWKEWKFWQYSSGRIPGISTPVDLDWLGGTPADLDDFFKPKHANS
jgi:lysozyme